MKSNDKRQFCDDLVRSHETKTSQITPSLRSTVQQRSRYRHNGRLKAKERIYWPVVTERRCIVWRIRRLNLPRRLTAVLDESSVEEQQEHAEKIGLYFTPLRRSVHELQPFKVTKRLASGSDSQSAPTRSGLFALAWRWRTERSRDEDRTTRKTWVGTRPLSPNGLAPRVFTRPLWKLTTECRTLAYSRTRYISAINKTAELNPRIHRADWERDARYKRRYLRF